MKLMRSSQLTGCLAALWLVAGAPLLVADTTSSTNDRHNIFGTILKHSHENSR
jgi:hypothetical protein